MFFSRGFALFFSLTDFLKLSIFLRITSLSFLILMVKAFSVETVDGFFLESVLPESLYIYLCIWSFNVFRCYCFYSFVKYLLLSPIYGDFSSDFLSISLDEIVTFYCFFSSSLISRGFNISKPFIAVVMLSN